MEREHLNSRLGFVLLSAGCAIGVGNVWKFPYMTGQNGGGAFVIIYLIFLVILGLPVMAMEFSMGRASQKSIVCVYKELVPDKKAWHIHGYLALAGNIILMMFYTSVCGWLLYYFVSTATGKFSKMSSAQVLTAFDELCLDAKSMVIYMVITVVIGFFICSFSLQKGLEKVTKFLMTALLAIMVVLAVFGFSLEGTKEGLSFYLKPDFTKLNVSVIVAAMNQAFFTLSLGIGAMAIFGSYIDKKRTLVSESISVIILDTIVAIIAGLIIFPACFTYNIEPDSGPNLIFVTLPNIFNNMPLGRLWGSLFFIFMSFAAFSTILAIFENIISCVRDLTGWSRKFTSVISCIAIIILSLPCALGYNVLSGFKPFGAGTSFLDLEDFLVTNILLPLGSLLFVLFCVSNIGWGWKNFAKEANTGKGIKISDKIRLYCTYALPTMIFVIFIIGLLSFFKVI